VSAIRELIYGLRPPALDDLGLLGAIRAVAERLAPDSEKLQIQVQALDDLPTLPAAVEVAAYRIAQEALTNVARHAHACSCRVRLSLEETASGGNHAALCLEIIDDGVGIAPERAAGVGLQSIRE
jgi:signal transduction histidine kinase